MPAWRFLLERRWLGYFAFATVVAIVCCLLGAWQFARRAEARTEITRVEQNWDHDPVPLAEAVPRPDLFDADDKWLPVLLEGEYLLDEQLLVRNRPFSGQPGFEILVPFQTVDGRIIVIDRGWLPTGSAQDLPDIIPAAPSGRVTVVARLKAGEPALDGRGAPEGQIATIELAQFEERLGGVDTGAYGLLAQESPAPAGPQAVLTTKPVPDEGPHLSYALQWYVFAVLAFVAFGYAARQEYRVLNADDPEERERAHERDRKRRERRSDADIEDEILEAEDREAEDRENDARERAAGHASNR